MFAFANKSHLTFEPASSVPFAVDATGTPYTTPEGLELRLGDLARLQYLTASLRYAVKLSAGDSTGKFMLAVKSGADVIGQKQIDCNGAEQYVGAFSVAVGDVVGADQLTVSLQVLTATGAGVTATVAAVLEVESPLVIGV